MSYLFISKLLTTVILIYPVRQLTQYACCFHRFHWLIIEFHVSIICCLATIRENKNLERGGGEEAVEWIWIWSCMQIIFYIRLISSFGLFPKCQSFLYGLKRHVILNLIDKLTKFTSFGRSTKNILPIKYHRKLPILHPGVNPKFLDEWVLSIKCKESKKAVGDDEWEALSMPHDAQPSNYRI